MISLVVRGRGAMRPSGLIPYMCAFAAQVSGFFNHVTLCHAPQLSAAHAGAKNFSNFFFSKSGPALVLRLSVDLDSLAD
jgi:hypothetical protein